VYPADLQAHGFGRCDKIIGQISLDIMIDKRPYSQTFHVLKTDSMYRYKILLGYDFLCQNRIAVCPPDPRSGIAESVLRTPDDVKSDSRPVALKKPLIEQVVLMFSQLRGK
jgi:hypothetical protein